MSISLAAVSICIIKEGTAPQTRHKTPELKDLACLSCLNIVRVRLPLLKSLFVHPQSSDSS